MNHMNKAGLLDSGAYLEFLQSKFRFGAEHGFSVPRNAKMVLSRIALARLRRLLCASECVKANLCM